jgi:Zn-dependent protease
MVKIILNSPKPLFVMAKTKAISWLFIALKSTKILQGLKAIKLLKPAIVAGSMLLSLVVYGFAFGWTFAVGLIAMIFIHEMGHVVAMKMKGFPVKAPVFIPMLGAVIFAPRNMTREQESFIGIGGPVLGTIGALIAWMVWFIHPDHPIVWLVMSYIGIFLNLFNMLPISPLDGGRITQSVGQWFKWVGLSLLMAVTLMTRDPGLLLVWIIVIWDMDTMRLQARKHMVAVVWLVLLVSTLAGLGLQDRWIYFSDAFVGLVIVAIIWASKKEDIEMIEAEMRKNGSDRPPQPLRRKIGWLIAFMGLTLLLLLSMSIQIKTLGPWLEEQKAKERQLPPPQIS